MVSVVVGVVDGDGTVRAERRRILSTLLERSGALVEAAVAAIRAEVPAYAAQEEQFFVDVRDQAAKHFRTKLCLLLEEHDATLEDVAFVRSGAMRRARAGFALEDYLNAFRVGQQVFWDAVLATAGNTPLGHQAALTLNAPLLRYCDFVSTHAGRAFVESQQYLVAEDDRQRRDLLEHLLAGTVPANGPLLAAARTYGLGDGTPMMVALAVVVGPTTRRQRDHHPGAAVAGEDPGGGAPGGDRRGARPVPRRRPGGTLRPPRGGL
jgi:hypothetical protein